MALPYAVHVTVIKRYDDKPMSDLQQAPPPFYLFYLCFGMSLETSAGFGTRGLRRISAKASKDHRPIRCV